MSHLRLRLAVVTAALVALAFAGGANAASSELFFSEYIEGSGQNKAVEIFNGTDAPVDLAAGDYNVFISFNGGTFTRTIDLVGTVAPGDVFVFAQATADPAILAHADQTDTSTSLWNGDDAVLLRKGTSVIDSIGQLGFDPGSQWGSDPTSTADNTLRRKIGVTEGDTDATNAFDPAVEWAGFAQNTFGGLGGHGGVAVNCGATLSVFQGLDATRDITASDPDDRVTALVIASVMPAPAAGSIALGPVTPATASGGTASATLTASGLSAGEYDVLIQATTADGETGTCTLAVEVSAIKTIGEVQGSVTDADLGPSHRSPFAPPFGNSSGDTVVVRGVVYQKTFALESDGDPQHGFFIQNTAVQADGDPTTSDGIWVFLGRFRDVLNAQRGEPSYLPQVGDEIVLQGRVTEFFNFTELSSPRFVQLASGGLDVDAVIPPVAVDPADDLTIANRQWERLEGMRVQVPGGSLVTDGLDVFGSTADAEMWVVRGDSEIAARTGYAQRVFRDAHPLDDEPGLVDNGNGFRILVGALGLKALADDNTVLLPPSRTFDTVTNALVGGLNFTFGKYRIETEDMPQLVHGIEPADNAPPTAGNRHVEYSVGDYNVENLYDFRDDPNDGCDFADDGGCPGVRPPFDYVPASDEVYQERLGLIAQQIVGDLHAPDILLVQEAEDQDICTVEGGALVCGAADDADGKPDTLQELALRIQAQSGIAYDAAYDRDGSDDRGIVAALMYRTDRVELLEPTADHPVLGSTPDFEYRSGANAYNADVENPKSLNAPLPDDVDTSTGTDGDEVFTRDPQVGWFRVWRNAVGVGGFVDVYAISNHFSSSPDRRVGQRTEQAAYLAQIVETLDSDRVVAGGDFNVFPRPDDPLVPASDQLAALYELGLHSVWETMVEEVPEAAYSYVFVGQAQTLDWQFLTPTLHDELVQSRVAHVNADYPAEFAGDGARGLSDHDPLASRFALRGLDPLANLLAYYRDAGAITGNNTYEQLRHHLEKSRTVGDAQLRAFINQVKGKAPRFVTQAAADALVAEANLLLEG